jgi:WD40 repeat protein
MQRIFLSALAIFSLSSTMLLGQIVRALATDDPVTIQFRHEAHREGEAKKVGEVSSPDGSVFARVIRESTKSDVQLFHVADGCAFGPLIELKAHRITALAIHPDNCTVATAIGNFSNDWGEVRLWNGKTGKETAKHTASPADDLPHLGEVFRLVFSEDGQTLTVASGPAGGK